MPEIRILRNTDSGFDQILSDDALDFVADLHRRFNERRLDLLATRADRQEALDRGDGFDFLAETAHVRQEDWNVRSVPEDLVDRRCEITGPTDRKMVINALNSGARVFMADFEDSNSPTWTNLVGGQINLFDAIRRQIDFVADTGKSYSLSENPATLMVRPRGWHLDESGIEVDGQPVSGSLFDFGLYFFHNATELLARGSGPYFYLPKLESHLEARLWNDVAVEVETQATVKLWIGDERKIAVGEGNGPVNALDAAVRVALNGRYPALDQVSLTDFKVRVLNTEQGTGAVTRVLLDSTNGARTWSTIGVSENIIEASWQALVDSLVFGLLHTD